MKISAKEAKRLIKQIKLIFQINTFNSEEYLWYVLKSIYDFADRIVIIDGAFRENMPSKYSTDKTKLIAGGFEDPHNKIIFIQAHSKSQTIQRNYIFNYTTGMDYLVLCDDDELYKPHHLIRLRKTLEKGIHRSYRIRGFNFVNSFDWYYVTDNMRAWRIEEGMSYKGPNTIRLGKNDFYYNRDDSPVIRRVIRFHYSYVREVKRLSIKRKQFLEFQKGRSFPWSRDKNFVKREAWKKLEFKKSHPSIMENHPYRHIKWSPE